MRFLLRRAGDGLHKLADAPASVLAVGGIVAAIAVGITVGAVVDGADGAEFWGWVAMMASVKLAATLHFARWANGPAAQQSTAGATQTSGAAPESAADGAPPAPAPAPASTSSP